MNTIIQTDKAPKAVGPYSQAVKVNNTIFTSGQLPIDPKTGKIVEGSVEEQTRQMMENLKNVLEAAGASLDLVVKTTLFITDIKDFQKINNIYGEYFPKNPPARATVEVSALALGAQVEADAIAVLPY